MIVQVISGFFVKRTKDIRESVAYLTVMTRYLQQHYSVSHQTCPHVGGHRRHTCAKDHTEILADGEQLLYCYVWIKQSIGTSYEAFS